MTSIATLRATNCSRLLCLAERVVAACGTKTAYIFQYKGDRVEEASCTAPREADAFAPWLPPGSPIAAARAVYSVSKDGGSAVLVQSTDGAAAAPLEIVSAISEKVEEMRIFYQSILVLQTASSVLFYFLDPTTSAATRMGVCPLPAWSDSRDVRIDVTSSECWAAAAEKTVCVMCLSAVRLYAAVVVCASSSSAVVVRRTADAGVPLPSSPAKVKGWTVRWGRQEMLLLLQPISGPEAKKTAATKALVSFSLQLSGGSASHHLLECWASADALATSVSGAAGVALDSATDICSDGDGTHVWLCDTVTGPTVILREVATPSREEVVLAGTNANSRLTVARGVSGMFVLAGRSLNVVRGNGSSGSTNAAAPKKSSSTNNKVEVNPSTTGTTMAAAGAVPEEVEEPSEATMSDWLEKRAEAIKATQQKSMEEQPLPQQQTVVEAATAPPSQLLQQQRPAKQPKPAKMTTTSVLTSSSSHIKEELQQYVLGTSPSVSFVVRDAVYVHEAAEGGATLSAPHHEILTAVAEKLGVTGDASHYALASLRYAAVAQSLHPYTVLELLNVRKFHPQPEEGLLLAMATLLAEKPTLQHGGLQRLPNFAAVSAAFFRTPGGAFTTELAKKRYTADVCAGAMAALANGGLGATSLLFAVADRAVSVLYGGRADADAPNAYSPEEQACEATIAESISGMRSFVEWSLTSSYSLGVMSAHVGSPQTLTKEAALRDGKAHPIATSRQVEIRPLQVTRLPKRTL
ncbi:hypothetical protein ABB37_00162 [Leptomonas pyrrhocoris]|uniref:Uncharacterized protein n=1 Tax=Leptomonas pyrrhocoris TaxID=157538 RepID=A0A0M9G9X9_LEPPY|nr:hypothetical protein ABB37_00162 [Leptomonas pyrrhocoris]KPA85823.1 hypothetical protein ABB37_00162 [Leptomonas pyrrhocoris]|eukprot:XP_015664262.1 hypothetical protein ABB37_00162 [Leptomonas pyrrhocoris]